MIGRVRCGNPRCAHPTESARRAWLRGLYVIIAAEPASASEAGPNGQPSSEAAAGKPRFTLWLTDENGYLSPVESANDAEDAAQSAASCGKQSKVNPKDSAKFFAGVKYQLLLILHPHEEEARKFLDLANQGADEVKDAILIKEAVVEPQGKNSKPEVVFIIDEEPTADRPIFLPRGGKLYNHLTLYYHEIEKSVLGKGGKELKDKSGKVIKKVLYRGMPNGDCAYIKDQVYRLQVHLGTLRYPVGYQSLPYWPSKKHKYCAYENAGIFDALTYNAVLAFQRDAFEHKVCSQLRRGSAVFAASTTVSDVITKDKHGKEKVVQKVAVDGLIDFGANYAPVYTREQFQQTAEYIRPSAILAREFLDLSVEEKRLAPRATTEIDTAHTIVDATTADEIQNWLDNGYRKRGHILIGVRTNLDPAKGGYDWLRDDAVGSFYAWQQAVRDLGFEAGVVVGHIFRDIRDCVLNAPPGKATRSIHKTGLAMDLLITGDFTQHKDFPILYQQVLSPDKKRVSWQLYGKVEKDLSPDEKKALVAELNRKTGKNLRIEDVWDTDGVSPWKFREGSFDGGEALPVETGTFVDITRVGQAFGFEPIGAGSSFKAHQEKIQIGTEKDFEKLLAFLTDARKVDNDKCDVVIERLGPPPSSRIVNIQSIDVDTLQQWLAAMKEMGWNSSAQTLIPPPDTEPYFKLQELLRTRFGATRFTISSVNGDNEKTDPIATGSSIDLSSHYMRYLRPHAGSVIFKLNDVVHAPQPGIARCQEYWHYQYQQAIGTGHTEATRNRWADLMQALGWTPEGLLKVGYPPGDLTRLAY